MSTVVKKGEDLKKTLEKFEQFVHLLSDFFETTKSSEGAKVKKDDLNEKDKKKFISRLHEIERRNEENTSLDDYPQTISLYEMSFLKDMISGEFNNCSEDSFSSKKDKNLFKKYNALSKKDQKERYKKFQNEIESLK